MTDQHKPDDAQPEAGPPEEGSPEAVDETLEVEPAGEAETAAAVDAEQATDTEPVKASTAVAKTGGPGRQHDISQYDN
jgi:hypothetical protein